MDRHPTERDVLVETMDCGCRLAILVPGLFSGMPIYLHSATVALDSCPKHAEKQWED